MPSPIDENEVRRIARLARLNLSDAEAKLFAAELGRVVAYVSELSSVATDGVAPLACPVPVIDVLRADEPQPGLPTDAALANAPETIDACFKVPAVLDTSAAS